MTYKIEGNNATQIAQAINRGKQIVLGIVVTIEFDPTGHAVVIVKSEMSYSAIHKYISSFMFMYCTGKINPLKLELLEEK
jgi:hypothetical protein